MRILALNFERAYSNSLQDDYSDKVQARFTEWFDDIFLGSRYIYYNDVNELVFNELTSADNQRVKNHIKEYSE